METYSLQLDISKYQRAADLTTKAVNRKTERGELLKEFMENINVARLGSPFKPLSMARIASLLAHIPTSDLYYLLSVCKASGDRNKAKYHQSFSKKFFYELKCQQKRNS